MHFLLYSIAPAIQPDGWGGGICSTMHHPFAIVGVIYIHVCSNNFPKFYVQFSEIIPPHNTHTKKQNTLTDVI